MWLLAFKILYNYPAGFVFFCLLTGLIYAAVLYYKNRSDGFKPLTLALLSSLRFLTVSVLAFLLLGPLLERLDRFVEEPLLIFIQDNSSSVIDAAHHSFDPEEYLQKKTSFLESMQQHFEVRHYALGESFRQEDEWLFDDKLTDLASAFDGIDGLYSNRNIGAVVLASDGIYNRGVNPVYPGSNAAYPVYTIALGDTLARRDLLVSRLRHNKIAYLGNWFPLEVQIDARQASGMSSHLSVSKDGTEVYSEVIAFQSDHHQQNILIELEAGDPGIQRYMVELHPIENEISTDNNSQAFYIEVIDGRQKVLILAHAPHPDVGALKESLQANDNYEVSNYLYDDFSGQPEAYNLIILHQIPAIGADHAGLLNRINSQDIPVLLIAGSMSDFNAGHNAWTGMDIEVLSEGFVETLPVFNQTFALFHLTGQETGLLQNLPPLYTPFASYVTASNMQLLFYQRIGQVTTEQPLIAFSSPGGRKTGIITGEGIWRWRLHTYLRNGSHEAFDELLSRMVQYLSLQEDKSLFRVKTAQFVYENDPILFEAELYNHSYELVNDPEVRLSVTQEDGIVFPYVMARTSRAYQLNAGSFPPGEYAYQAVTTLGGETFQAQGVFHVSQLNLESLRTIADHQLLFQLSANTGGKLTHAGQWDELREHILSRDDIRPVMYARRTLDEVINMKGIFFLLLILLATEWFVRKRSGSY